MSEQINSKKDIAFKVVVGSRVFSWQVSPAFIVLTLAILGLAYVYWPLPAEDDVLVQTQARLEKLETEKKQLQGLLDLKEKEKNQMLTLAEARSQELWNALEAKENEIREIWEVVGASPSEGDHKHSLQGSRSGSSVKVKMNYWELKKQIGATQSSIENLKGVAKDYRKEVERQRELARVNSTPTLHPCHESIISGFGYRVHPVYGYSRLHSGVDYGAATGTPIRAAAAGSVSTAGWLGGYGLAVELNHGNEFSTLYAHCSSLAVSPGVYVKKGDIIGYVGNTGLSTGPHLHFEVHVNGTAVDPTRYLESYDIVSR